MVLFFLQQFPFSVASVADVQMSTAYVPAQRQDVGTSHVRGQVVPVAALSSFWSGLGLL